QEIRHAHRPRVPAKHGRFFSGAHLPDPCRVILARSNQPPTVGRKPHIVNHFGRVPFKSADDLSSTQVPEERYRTVSGSRQQGTVRAEGQSRRSTLVSAELSQLLSGFGVPHHSDVAVEPDGHVRAIRTERD